MVSRLIEDTAALEPGDVQAGDYLRKPEVETTDKPEVAGMMVSGLESAGWSILYDTQTREPSVVNNNMKVAQMKVRRLDGTLVFTAIQPIEGPRRGSIKCFLHKDQPEHSHYTAMGFDACGKATLPNQFQAENHARNKHRDEWRAVESEREAREHAEDRKAQLAMLQAVQGSVAPVATEPITPFVVEMPVVEPPPFSGDMGPVQRSGQCLQCDWHSNAAKSATRKNSLKQHMGKVHAGVSNA